jgi:hypothetical protein
LLPEALNTTSLSDVEGYKLEAFYQRFVVQRYHDYGDGHFLLACYAAFPVLLTPDLLYQLWLNFSTYQDRGEVREIARVAVADLLLSSLCEEISFEMYEMSPAIRNVLMDYWQQSARGENKANLPQIEQVARFLLQYIHRYKNPNHQDAQAFRDAQEWMALTYLQPQKATKMMHVAMAATMNQMQVADQNRMAKMEMMRLVELSKRAGARYEMQLVAANQLPSSSLMAMMETAEDLKKIVAGKLDTLDVTSLGNYLTDAPSEGALALEVPKEVISKIPQFDQNDKMPKLYAIFIGAFKAEATKNSIIIFENNQRFELKNIEGYQKIEARAIANADIEAIINLIYEQATANDHIWIYQDNTQNYNDIFYTIYNKKAITALPHSTIFTYFLPTFELLPSDRVSFVYNIPLRNEAGRPSLFFQLFMQSKGRLPFQKMVAIVSHDIDKTNKANPNAPPQTLPELLAVATFARRPFLSIQNDVLDLQYLLRQLGGYDSSVNGIYNAATDAALKRVLKNSSQEQLATNKVALIAALEKQREIEQATARPLYIFVFANPDQNLAYTVQERAFLEGLLRDTIKENNAEAIFLHDPDKQEVMEYFMAAAYRNRMQIFHFSGYDQSPYRENLDTGLFLKENQLITFQDLNQWLDFQENLQFCFFNSCRLKGLAHSLTLRGLNAAIAADDVILDDYAFQFAKAFYEALVKGKDIEAAFKEAKYDDDSQQQSYSNSNIHRSAPPEYQQQSNYYEPPSAQNNFELLFNWVKKAQTLSWRLSENITKQQDSATAATPAFNNHLLVIAINQYQHKSPILDDDLISDIIETLKEKYFFDEKYVIELYNESATNRNIRETFSHLSDALTPEDNLFILLQGQSRWEKERQQLIWQTYDASEEAAYLSDNDLKDLICRIACNQVVLVADLPKTSVFEFSDTTKGALLPRAQSYWGILSNRNTTNMQENHTFFEKIRQLVVVNEEDLNIQHFERMLDKSAWQGALFGSSVKTFVLPRKPTFPFQEIYNLLESNKIEKAIRLINEYYNKMKNIEPYAYQSFMEITEDSPSSNPFVSFEEQLENDALKEALMDFIQEHYAPRNNKSALRKKK